MKEKSGFLRSLHSERGLTVPAFAWRCSSKRRLTRCWCWPVTVHGDPGGDRSADRGGGGTVPGGEL
ncbi:hypothetical protein SAMN00767673_0711 [Rubrobacter radiotolerans DSM 5868]|nr:hypothetical protein SAMN00767673_0711 [Rubrobacter radiotolerans DSM 5868]